MITGPQAPKNLPPDSRSVFVYKISAVTNPVVGQIIIDLPLGGVFSMHRLWIYQALSAAVSVPMDISIYRDSIPGLDLPSTLFGAGVMSIGASTNNATEVVTPNMLRINNLAGGTYRASNFDVYAVGDRWKAKITGVAPAVTLNLGIAIHSWQGAW